MINFVDRYGKESWLMYMRQPTASEISSSLVTFWDRVRHGLLNGMIGRWMTDNSKGFLGSETEKVAKVLAERR